MLVLERGERQLGGTMSAAAPCSIWQMHRDRLPMCSDGLSARLVCFKFEYDWIVFNRIALLLSNCGTCSCCSTGSCSENPLDMESEDLVLHCILRGFNWLITEMQSTRGAAKRNHGGAPSQHALGACSANTIRARSHRTCTPTRSCPHLAESRRLLLLSCSSCVL